MEEERVSVEVRTRPRPALPASQQRAVEEFWRRRQEEIEATADFKERMLPMARLRKVIRASTTELEEDDGMMISADTPAFLSKLCELFVQELAVRAWACDESHNRRIILDRDIAEAVASTEYYDFLVPVLIGHLHQAAAARGGRATTPATARLVTRKRHRPDPDTRSPPAPPSSVHYMPFPFPCALGEGATPEVDELMLPAAPSMNYTTRDCVFFSDGDSSGNTFAGEYSAAAAGMVRSPPLAGFTRELHHNVPPAAYYFDPYPVTDDSDEAFSLGNTDPSANTGIPIGNADLNGGSAFGIADGGGQQQNLSENVAGHGESVVVQQSSDDVHAVQDAVAGFLGGTDNESPMYMLLEEILMEEDLLYPPDADLFPLAGAPLHSEDFIVDQHVLEDAFADPSSSSTSSN